MKLLVDNQLPLLLAEYLRERGHECVHVLEVGLDEADDSELWTRCLREERVLISKDEDFVFLASRRHETGRLIWVRLGNCRNMALIAAFERALDGLIHAFETGQRIVELR
jgi:predicted nuclease of predicted toxin-antitoxin system